MKKTRAWVGVDPGAKGAAFLFDEDGTLEVHDWFDESSAAHWFRCMAHTYDIQRVVIEDVSINPMQKAGSGKLMENKGMWRGIVSALALTVNLVRPQAWKKKMLRGEDLKAKNKEAALPTAKREFPLAECFDRKKDIDRAEACLMALYGKRWL